MRASLHVGHERGRPADVRAGAAAGRASAASLSLETSGPGVAAVQFRWRGLAVEHVLVGVRQRGEQGVRFGGQRMLPRAAALP